MIFYDIVNALSQNSIARPLFLPFWGQGSAFAPVGVLVWSIFRNQRFYDLELCSLETDNKLLDRVGAAGWEAVA